MLKFLTVLLWDSNFLAKAVVYIQFFLGAHDA